MTECPNCEKLFGGPKCPLCGWQTVSLATTTAALATFAPARRCPFDGAPLEGDHFCPRGDGYPIGTVCPFACPICRQPLEWSGGCFACHGCTTGTREDWTFPGDGYYTHEMDGKQIGDGHHWVKGQGPRRACSRDENRDGARAIVKILGSFLPFTEAQSP